MVYQSLWDIDGNGEKIWYLATDLDLSNPVKWVVKLREGVKFANGNPLTADDVLFSLYRANNRTGEPMTFPELDYDNCKAIDDYTVEIAFHQFDIGYVSGFAQCFIFDKESHDDNAIATIPNGTGPYAVSEYVINSHLNLTARDDYWGDKPPIKTLHFVLLSEEAQRVNALQTGIVDISGVPFQDIEFVQTLDGLTVQFISNAMTRTIYMNPSQNHSSVFYDNVDARKAVAYAIDRQAIIDIAYSGFAKESRHMFSGDNVDMEDRFLDKGIYGVGYDPVKAKELAESSGLAGKEVLLINNGSADGVVVAELLQSDLKAIGVTVNVLNLDPGSWLSYVFDDTQYDIAVDFTLAPSQTLAQNFYSWTNYHVGGAFTRNPWPGSEKSLPVINTIMTISDPAQLSDIYMELTDTLTEAMLWYSLVDLQNAVAYNSKLIGYAPMLIGNVHYNELSWAA
jgi:peptide/nickel transport system substrate-binding protein